MRTLFLKAQSARNRSNAEGVRDGTNSRWRCLTTMLAAVQPDDALEVLMIGTSVVLAIKRLGEMDKYFEVRLFAITFVLSLAAILIFIGYGLSLFEADEIEYPDNHYCLTEI